VAWVLGGHSLSYAKAHVHAFRMLFLPNPFSLSPQDADLKPLFHERSQLFRNVGIEVPPVVRVGGAPGDRPGGGRQEQGAVLRVGEGVGVMG